LNNKF